MSELQGAYEDLTAFLRANGWVQDEAGSAGSIWRRAADDSPVAVPFGVTSNNDAWRDAVERVAAALKQNYGAADQAIRLFYYDVQNLRAKTDPALGGSILIEAGFNLFSTGRMLVRSAASTARSHKVQIAGNYGVRALRIADRARFGQTHQGSYEVPLLMPLERPHEPVTGMPAMVQDESVEHAFIEPEERKVTRTLARAVTAIQNHIVEPGVEPTASIVTPLVGSGVSREMVLAIAELVASPGVGGFEVRFNWSPAFEAPPVGRESVEIPHDSVELLRKAASYMKAERKQQGEHLTGRIIDLADDEETGFRRATIRTLRRGRQVKVDVLLDESMTERAHEWFQSKVDIAVAGVVKSAPSIGIRIEEPQQFAPIDDIVLVKVDGEPAPKKQAVDPQY